MAHHTGKTLANYPGDPSQLLNNDYLYKSFYVDFVGEDPGEPRGSTKRISPSVHRAL